MESVPSAADASAQEHNARVMKNWLEHQKMLVNENRLNLADKKARDYLVEQMEKYFFGSGADVAAGYNPPSQK